MKRFLGSKKERHVLIAFGIELLILFFLVVMLFIPKKSYILDADNNTISLPYGHYYITCNFQIDNIPDAVNFLHIENMDGTTKGIKQVDNYLNKEHNSYTSEFWISSLYKHIQLSVREIGKTAESSSATIDEYIITSTPYVIFEVIIFLIIAMAVTVIIYLSAIGKICFNKEKITGTCILAAAFFISCIPLFGDKLLLSDDTMVHLIRLEGIKDGYLAGQFPVKVEPTFNGGYGYAFSTYYGSLYYNIAVIFRLMGFSIINSYKAYVVVVNLATVILAYYSLKIIFKNEKTAVFGSVFYSLSLYRLYDLYQRGAVGEYTAMVFLPIIAAGLWRIYTTPVHEKNYSGLWIMPVIGYSGVIESHILSTELYGAFTILLCLIMAKKTFRKQTFLVLLKIVLITAILNIGFILPFAESYMCESVIVNSDMLTEPRLSLGLSATDVFKFYTGGNADKLWRNYIRGGLGPSFLVVLTAFVYIIIKIKGDIRYKRLLLVTGIITLVSLVLSMNIFPWNGFIEKMYTGIGNNATVNALVKKLSLLFINVQFRTRFMIVGIMTYTIFTCAVLSQIDAGGILKLSKSLMVVLTVVQFIWAGVFIMIKSERTGLYTISPEDQDVTCSIGNFEYIPLKGDGGMPYFDSFKKPLTCLSTNAEVTAYNKEYTNIYIHVKTENDNVGIVELPLLYYRGYKAFDIETGKSITVFKSNSNARLGLIVENGYEGDIKVYYAGKTTWHVAEIISCVTFLLIIFYSIKKSKVD